MAGKTKIWVGVGAFLLTSGGLSGCTTMAEEEPAPQVQAEQGKHAHDRTKPGGEGGEGGEGGARGPVDTDEELKLALYQMRGHLFAAHSLYEDGHKQEAVAHFYHPTAEVYPSVEQTLERRDVPQFADEINALGKLAATGADLGQVHKAHQNVLQRIRAASESVAAEKRNTPEFVVPVLVDLLQVAAHEYDVAVQDGKFVNVVEYQDAFGFANVAQQELNALAPKLKQKNAQAYQELQTQLKALMQALPSVAPPAQPTLEPSAVFGIVSRIELAAQGLQ